jgi:hypothetical protein
MVERALMFFPFHFGVRVFGMIAERNHAHDNAAAILDLFDAFAFAYRLRYAADLENIIRQDGIIDVLSAGFIEDKRRRDFEYLALFNIAGAKDTAAFVTGVFEVEAVFAGELDFFYFGHDMSNTLFISKNTVGSFMKIKTLYISIN